MHLAEPQQGCVQAVVRPPQPPALRRPGATRTASGRASWRRGRRAEQLACERLVGAGWRILRRRVRTPCGEIDIVAEHEADDLIAFVEVKARPTLAEAAGSLSVRQRQRLLAAADWLLAQNPAWRSRGLRFDLLVLDETGGMRRLRDVFRLETGT